MFHNQWHFSTPYLETIITDKIFTIATKSIKLIEINISKNRQDIYEGNLKYIKRYTVFKIDAFELCCWRRLLRVPWTARRSNQSILKEISPVLSLQGLMLKLKLQYFDHLIRRAASFEKTLMLGKIEGRTRRGQQRMRWFDCIGLTQWTWILANSER